MKLTVMIVVFVSIICLLVGVFTATMGVMTGVRAYVRGEGLWTNGQKDAIYYIARYARTHDRGDYRKYEHAIAVPLGDHIARVELGKPDYDYATVHRGFVQGGNHPDDVAYMVFLFRWFHHISFIDRAIGIWAAADTHILQLAETGAELHEALVAGRLSAARQSQLLTRIEHINAALTPLEIAFSSTLNQGARWTRSVLFGGTLLAALLLLAVGLWVAWRISRGLRTAIAHLREGVIRVGAGDLDHRIAVVSEDELGDLSRAFNAMIEHRRQAANALERQREFQDAILENLSEGVVACDENGILSLFNRATRDFHGIAEEALPPEQWAGHYHLYRADGATPLPQNEVPLYLAYQGLTVHDAEIVIAPAGRPMRTVLVSGQPIVTRTGRKLGAVIAMHDITERKRAESELIAHADELARSNAELEQFAYVASHDLQEPLRTVGSYTQLLARRYRDRLDADADEFIGYIEDAVHRMREQISGLLDYGRVSQGDAPAEQAQLDALLTQALAALGSAIEDSGANVTHDTLPQVAVHAAQITQVFQNLIGNALKFRGDAAPAVHVSAQRDGDNWLISVADNGIGLDPAHGERIFRLYQRLHGRDAYPGSGLGLAICRKIVEHHGGRIWVEQAEGSGSIFRFELPANGPPESV